MHGAHKTQRQRPLIFLPLEDAPARTAGLDIGGRFGEQRGVQG